MSRVEYLSDLSTALTYRQHLRNEAYIREIQNQKFMLTKGKRTFAAALLLAV